LTAVTGVYDEAPNKQAMDDHQVCQSHSCAMLSPDTTLPPCDCPSLSCHPHRQPWPFRQNSAACTHCPPQCPGIWTFVNCCSLDSSAELPLDCKPQFPSARPANTCSLNKQSAALNHSSLCSRRTLPCGGVPSAPRSNSSQKCIVPPCCCSSVPSASPLGASPVTTEAMFNEGTPRWRPWMAGAQGLDGLRAERSSVSTPLSWALVKRIATSYTCAQETSSKLHNKPPGWLRRMHQHTHLAGALGWSSALAGTAAAAARLRGIEAMGIKHLQGPEMHQQAGLLRLQVPAPVSATLDTHASIMLLLTVGEWSCAKGLGRWYVTQQIDSKTDK
jgi:hypothetical protein